MASFNKKIEKFLDSAVEHKIVEKDISKKQLDKMTVTQSNYKTSK